MYGRYPIDERWRVDLTAILLLIGLVPMAIPKVPYKPQTILYLLTAFPVVALILLTGGPRQRAEYPRDQRCRRRSLAPPS